MTPFRARIREIAQKSCNITDPRYGKQYASAGSVGVCKAMEQEI